MRKLKDPVRQSASQSVEVEIDCMRLVDLPEIMKIEIDSFAAPWPSSLFIREILADSSFPLILRIAEKGHEKIVAFSVCRATGEHLHITNIAVHPRYRRRGFARILLLQMCDIGKQHGCTTASLEVRVSNKKAIRLYEKEGFVPQGRLRRYYEDNDEDAFLCVKPL